MRPTGMGGHIRRYGSLITPCWCEREAAPISAEMIRLGETWCCDEGCYRRYLQRIQVRAGLA